MENEEREFGADFEELKELLENKRYSDLKKRLADMFEQDVAEFLGEVDSRDDMVRAFRLLSKKVAADVFAYMEPDLQETLIGRLTDTEIHNIIEDLSFDDAADALEELPANVVKHVLDNATPDTRNTINRLLQYEEDSAGSIMTTEYIDLKLGTTAEEAIKRIRKLAKETEQLNTFYVTDQRVLKGVVSIRDLILAKPDAPVEEFMETDLIYGETFTDQETLAHLFKKYDVLTLPIVDKEQRLVGIVTVDDIIDIINLEATEDIQKMAAIVPTEKPYLKQSVFSIWKARIPWLLLLMISATFTSMILSGYETRLASLATGAVLYAFVPMLMDTAGNAGGQSSVTVIRSLALNEIEFKDIFRIVWKEFRAALLLAATVAVVCFAKLLLIDRLYNDISVPVAAIVSGVLFITIVMAKFVGCILPLIAKKCRLDPAVVASPFITTIVDALSLIIYCSVAIALLA